MIEGVPASASRGTRNQNENDQRFHAGAARAIKKGASGPLPIKFADYPSDGVTRRLEELARTHECQ